ncbi:MAG: hypothetical protein AAGC74_00920 [Verrucomicrobiota bacterium]
MSDKITIQLTKSEREALQILSNILGLSPSDVAREAIQEFLAAREFAASSPKEGKEGK